MIKGLTAAREAAERGYSEIPRRTAGHLNPGRESPERAATMRAAEEARIRMTVLESVNEGARDIIDARLRVLQALASGPLASAFIEVRQVTQTVTFNLQVFVDTVKQIADQLMEDGDVPSGPK